MLDLAMLQTTIMLAITSGGAALATLATVTPLVTTPNHAPQIAGTFSALFAGMIMQGWTHRKRKPTPEVMIADIMASGVCGFIVTVIGVPICLLLINKCLPEDIQISVDIKDHLGWTMVLSWFAGLVGVMWIRKKLDHYFPGWDGDETRK